MRFTPKNEFFCQIFLDMAGGLALFSNENFFLREIIQVEGLCEE
jgi:hypothetical protein